MLYYSSVYSPPQFHKDPLYMLLIPVAFYVLSTLYDIHVSCTLGQVESLFPLPMCCVLLNWCDDKPILN